MEKTEKFIEVCIGIGMNQLLPEYIKIPVIQDEDDEYTGFYCPMCSTIPNEEEKQ